MDTSMQVTASYYRERAAKWGWKACGRAMWWFSDDGEMYWFADATKARRASKL
jgi:hypothetical protein